MDSGGVNESSAECEEMTNRSGEYSVNKLILLDCCDCYTRRACVILSAHREREGR